MLREHKRATIGRKAIRDLLHIAKTMGITDDEWAQASGLSCKTFR